MVTGVNPYRASQAETAGPEERVVMLYDGARRFVDQAGAALEAKDYAAVSLYVGKAQRILEELMVTLNFDVGGQIAKNLYQLYEFWSWWLGQGLLKKEGKQFRDVSAALSDMREAWAEAAKQVRAQRLAHVHG